MISRPSRCEIMLIVLASACAPKANTKEETVPNEAEPAGTEVRTTSEPGISPRWRAGDEWDVHYRISVGSVKKMADPPPAFEEHDWTYRVADVGPDGGVLISAHLKSTDEETWRMRFATSGRLLVLERPEEEPESIATAPYVEIFNGGTVERLAKEWPVFPLLADDREPPPDEKLVQHVVVQRDRWQVTIIARGSARWEPDERIVTQEWERDRPWWSSVSVRERTTWEGKTSNDVVIEGHVTAWRLREGE